MSEFCLNGNHHQWAPTGRHWTRWTSDNSSAPPPENAPVDHEMQCQVCGDFSLVSATMENMYRNPWFRDIIGARERVTTMIFCADAEMTTLQSWFSPKRYTKLQEALVLLAASIEAKGWLPKASRKVRAAMYAGATSHCFTREEDALVGFHATMALNWGTYYPENTLSKHDVAAVLLHCEEGQVAAWMTLVEKVTMAADYLDMLKPAPVVTPLGLSPKVTATLQNANQNLDPATCRFPEIEVKIVDQEVLYNILWTPGTLFHQTRYNGGHCCEACGKPIPSGNFVPLEITDSVNHSPVGMWVGCDCARNLFGIKHSGYKSQELMKGV